MCLLLVISMCLPRVITPGYCYVSFGGDHNVFAHVITPGYCYVTFVGDHDVFVARDHTRLLLCVFWW